MATVQEAFEFDDDDLMSNRQGIMSAYQTEMYRQSRKSRDMEWLIGTALVAGMFIVLLVYRSVSQNQPMLILSGIILLLVIICLLLYKNLKMEKPRRKAKRQLVHSIRGSAHVYSWRGMYKKSCYRVRINNDLAFRLSRKQYEALENKARYVFYFANSQILSVEKISDK